MKFNPVAACLIVAASITIAGCPRDDDRPDVTATGPWTSMDPRDELAGVFDRYRNASGYRDNGEAILRIDETRSRLGSSGSPDQSRAPLRVIYHGDELHVDAYTARIRLQRRDGQTNLTAWFDEPQTSDFDGQVVRSFWPESPSDQGRLNVDRISDDVVLHSRLSAGLAGPPPQLEWLFAADPMTGLFADGSTFSRMPSAMIDQANMRRIEVVSRSLRYVFWIDAASDLIRRVEMPVPAGVLAASPSAKLTLELRDATFTPEAASIDPSGPLNARHDVVRFVPLPPPPPSPLIGKRIDGGFPEQVIGPERRPSSAATICVIHLPAGREAAMAAIPIVGPLVPTQSMVAMVTDEPGAVSPMVGDAAVVLDARTHDSLTQQLRMPPGSMTLLGWQGRVLMIQPSIGPDAVSTMAAAIGDAAAGIDLPRRLMDDYQRDLDRYQSELSAALHRSR